MDFEIYALPAFADNYIWLVRRDRQLAVIDPGDAGVVRRHLDSGQLILAAILVTHHHADHTGGVKALLGCGRPQLYGPAGLTFSQPLTVLRDGDELDLPALGARFAVLGVPGHTADHLAYYGHGSLFCGDTLFACGCGRVFEGTPARLHASLQRLAALPAATAVYCAHEYTLANLRFARQVLPQDDALRARALLEQSRRQAGIPTVPSTLAVELATNPFLRTADPAVIASLAAQGLLQGRDPAAVFTALRAWKDRA